MRYLHIHEPAAPKDLSVQVEWSGSLPQVEGPAAFSTVCFGSGDPQNSSLVVAILWPQGGHSFSTQGKMLLEKNHHLTAKDKLDGWDPLPTLGPFLKLTSCI